MKMAHSVRNRVGNRSMSMSMNTQMNLNAHDCLGRPNVLLPLVAPCRRGHIFAEIQIGRPHFAPTFTILLQTEFTPRVDRANSRKAGRLVPKSSMLRSKPTSCLSKPGLVSSTLSRQQWRPADVFQLGPCLRPPWP